jgi:phosphoribosylglycinamide formyltransferase-1
MSRLAILISGAGSNMRALIQATQQGEITAETALVLADREAPGLAVARTMGVTARCLPAAEAHSREAYDTAVLHELRDAGIEWVILAGYMRILSEAFVESWRGRMLNIHPSLLPKYKGLHTHQRVIQAGDREHGTTVHFVTPELDGGPAVLQAKFAVHARDDEARLRRKVQACEHRIYPEAVGWLTAKRLTWREEGLSTLDGKRLEAPIERFFDENFFVEQGIPPI